MRVKSPYAEPRIVPWLGDRVVDAGEIVDVPGEHLANYVAAGWTPTDAQAKAAAAKLAEPAADSDSATDAQGVDEQSEGASDGDR